MSDIAPAPDSGVKTDASLPKVPPFDGATAELDPVLLPPIITAFNVSETELSAGGGEVNLSWSVEGAETLMLVADPPMEIGALTGELLKLDVGQSTTFSLVAVNSVGSAERTVAVNLSASGQLDWTSQFGSTIADHANSVSVGPDGSAFIAGETYGALADVDFGGTDAFLSRISPQGELVWTRQLGTEEADQATSVAFHGSGDLIVAGSTEGDFAGSNEGGSDVFVSRYTGEGAVVWSQQAGTATSDFANAVAVGPTGSIFLAGSTGGDLGGINHGGTDAFVMNYTADGELLWGRILGSEESDIARAIAVDAEGGIFVGGSTEGALGGDGQGQADVFIARYSANGELLWARQLGSEEYDHLYAMAVNSNGEVIIAGNTGGTLGVRSEGGSDLLLGSFSAEGELLWTRQTGTDGYDLAVAVAIDSSGNIFVGGQTSGTLGTANAGGTDGFVARYTAAGEQRWVYQLGTMGNDSSLGLALAATGHLVTCGSTSGDLGASNLGGPDAFIARFR